eukprot:1137994-Pelagomonas_calceolata.AAC.3
MNPIIELRQYKEHEPHYEVEAIPVPVSCQALSSFPPCFASLSLNLMVGGPTALSALASQPLVASSARVWSPLPFYPFCLLLIVGSIQMVGSAYMAIYTSI